MIMKKILLLPILSVILLAGFSCSKCQVCTKESEPEIRVCQKDYGNNTQYGLALDAYEASGYSCKNSL